MAKIQCTICGGIADLGQEIEGECPYCGRTVSLRRISSFAQLNNVEVTHIRSLLEAPDAKTKENKNLPLGLCYLKVGNYTLAQQKFAQAIEESPECAEAYFYFSVAMLHGKRLESISMREARQAAEYLKTAIALDDKFVFPKLLYGLLCLEYYEGNDLTPPADGAAVLNELADAEIDPEEFAFFKQMIPTEVV